MYGTGVNPSPALIVIVDENWALCRGYSEILDDAGLFATTRVNTTDACICKVQTWPDTGTGLVILGPNLDERAMFGSLRWLHEERPQIKNIVISRRAADSTFCLDVAANHVSACLPVTAKCEDIAQAVLDVLAGRTLFASDMLQEAFQSIKLSAREQDVLRLMAEGLTYSQMAKALVLSSKTVDNHRQSIFKKLNVDNKEAAVTRSYRRGLL
jgi:DNA-binding NarL/FixJ family response regulator